MTTGTDTLARHWIDGAWQGGSGSIAVVNPATGETLAEVPAGGTAEIDAAVLAARHAFPAWAARPLADRVAAVTAIREGIKARSAEIAASITAEMGSPTKFASSVQVGMPMATSKGVAGLAESFPWTEEIGNSLVVREPIGVVGAVTPWNYPLHQVVAKVAPALVAGCTIVLKPSEVAPLTASILAQITAEAGLPAGVFNVVHGTGPEAGEALAKHPGVDMVSFTGSVPAGRRVQEVAAATVKRVALELGGKSANIVLDDADLTQAVKLGLGNCFINGGQTCTAWTRLLVPASLHDQVVEMAVEQSAKYTVGDPTEESTRIGPMSSERQRERVEGYITTGVSEGAELAAGGPGRPDGLERGAYVRPTIFSGVRPDMTIAQEEIFGPVLSVMPYDTEDEAVEIANATVYGLAGAVFAGSQERGVEVAKRMRTGQVDVNGGAFNPLAPFGGYKQSGTGRELGRYGLEEFLEVKSIQL
ncbi:aldehyde dehydrogenase family protein [Actinomycetospora callitridis]|uniref:aldehyde dehydrogenase family protein n=1 Tax=Actinomycetospora callitridis TaxID=913944 RepID=UPI002366404B|nr:aldehyde dehydrogenase family protein [Actinomycetospora callitridis]MDD7919423.1 aldehyde dehydrogenase family protein [Actinomycetospora callitridis]